MVVVVVMVMMVVVGGGGECGKLTPGVSAAQHWYSPGEEEKH